MFNDGRSYFQRVKFGQEKASEVRRIRKNSILENEWIKFYNDDVEFPNGHQGKFLRLETPNRDGTVVVAVRASSSKIAVVKQYRYAPGLWMVEIPRGFAQASDVLPIVTGIREFGEEVGGLLRIEKSWSLGRIVTDSGKLADAPFIVMAELWLPPDIDDRFKPHPDETEVIAHTKYGHWIDYRVLKNWVETGIIVDAFTCAAMARVAPHFDQDGNYRPDHNLLTEPMLENAASLFGDRE